MGFWHTGYFEHHEPSGLEGNWHPAPAIYRCQHCDAQFKTPEALRQHRFEAHPYIRPTMFIRGIELGASPVFITRPIVEADFYFGTFEAARLNGEVLTGQQLSRRLTAITNDRIQVELSNVGVSATFDLHFQVAKMADLEGVDRQFLLMADRRKLSVAEVEGFILASKPYSTAIMYVDGIVQYLYGVMAKEHLPELSIPHTDYRERFSAAAAALADYERALSRLIRGLVAFQFNQFADAATLAPPGRLRAAGERFRDALDGAGWVAPTRCEPSVDAPEELLTDSETHQILRWSDSPMEVLVADVHSIAAMARRDDSAYGRLKARILHVAALEEGADAKSAIKIARDLLTVPGCTAMAERMIERLKQRERSDGNR